VTSVRVAEVANGPNASRDAFHAVPGPLYASQPPGTAPTRDGVERGLARPEFQAAQQPFVVFVDDVPAGRLVARVSPTLQDDNAMSFGMLGFFECRNHAPAARALFDAAIAWLRARGASRIVGPMDGDTWHRYRVNVGPYDRPPFPLEPWNPSYYAALWEAHGFAVLETYSSKWIDDVSVLLPGLEAGLARSEARGVRVRRLKHGMLRDELALVHDLSSRIFADAFLYSPIPREEFLALYAGMERFLDPELVLFAETDSGEPVGFVFAYDDPARPAVHYKTIGVVSEWRRPGVAHALSYHVYRAALRRGRPQGNHALMRDDNRSQALDQGHGERFRRYVLYEWPGRVG
jgi:GNAT superfamily N-acetyltransferase